VSVLFGECRLDIAARRLFRGSREIHLAPKAFDLLRVLVEARPRALSKADLLERVWPGVFVSEASLARVVSLIRNGVGDAARPARIVRTVHKYGYAFVAEVADQEQPSRKPDGRQARASCWLVCGRRVLPLTDGENIVGRGPDAGVWLDSPKVSRHHARLVVSGAQVTIEDLASKNGTLVGGARIAAIRMLEPGDRIQVGPFTLTFRASGESRSTETEAVTRRRPRSSEP
jgi:DNA-binding winged helix-turn-helix (wHTH) protein